MADGGGGKSMEWCTTAHMKIWTRAAPSSGWCGGWNGSSVRLAWTEARWEIFSRKPTAPVKHGTLHTWVHTGHDVPSEHDGLFVHIRKIYISIGLPFKSIIVLWKPREHLHMAGAIWALNLKPHSSMLSTTTTHQSSIVGIRLIYVENVKLLAWSSWQSICEYTIKHTFAGVAGLGSLMLCLWFAFHLPLHRRKRIC